jgi:solute carrier family 15 oligopeptide transporter 1
MNIESEIETVIETGKLLFPKHIILIILNQFCERFSFFGLRTILIIYFTQFLKTSDNTAVAYFHTFSMIGCFASLLGAFISDGYIGQYKTILYLSLIYGFGDLILCLTSMKPFGAPRLAVTLTSLLIIAFGAGGIAPCCVAFGFCCS